MATVTYRGPADVFVVDGKQVRQGEKVTMDADRLQHHRLNGHVFEGDGQEPAPRLVSTPQHPIALGDDGQPLDQAKAEKEAKTLAPTPTGVTSIATP